MLPSGYRCHIDCGLKDGARRTKSLVSIFTRFPKQLSSLDVGNQMTERCSQAMLGHR